MKDIDERPYWLSPHFSDFHLIPFYLIPLVEYFVAHWSVHLQVHHSLHQSIVLSPCLSVCLSIHLSVCLSINLLIILSICPPTHFLVLYRVLIKIIRISTFRSASCGNVKKLMLDILRNFKINWTKKVGRMNHI